VRLSFHDCISGCNGCINSKNPDNGGLKDIVILLTQMHFNFKDQKYYGISISRADFWVLVAYRAIYISSNYPNLNQPILNFKFGRKDCTSGALLDELEILPGANTGWDKVKSTFTKFNLTNREIVAIMGTHALGGAKYSFSGYEGWFNIPWVIFDNSYYKNLMNKTIDYVSTPIGEKYQWNSAFDKCNSTYVTSPKCLPKLTPRFLLNSDMCLYKNFIVDDKGKPSCTYATCGVNQETSSYVEEFANSELVFKRAFGPVYDKITEHGYPIPCTLIDPLKPCS
jgi:catalase (peroxidase I)